MRKTILALILLLPAAAFARDCDHAQDYNLSLDLDGVKAVVFEIGPHDLQLTATPGAKASAQGHACASRAKRLERLDLTQRRVGDRLVVHAGSEGGSWEFNLFGKAHYARLSVTASLPDTVPVHLAVGSGDATVSGVRTLDADVGSGDIRVSDIRGQFSLHVGSGDAEVEDVGALQIASIGSGDVTASGVRGATRVGSIGSGDFDLVRTKGDVDIGSIGSGDAQFHDVGGDVRIGSLGSGDIEVRNVRGDLVVRSSGSGEVRHSGVGGRIDLPAED
jgi:hypothetical protein